MKLITDIAREEVERIDFEALKKAGIERTLEDYYILGNYPPLIVLEDVKEQGIDIFQGNGQGEFDIYLHFPFCESRCSYCHFYSTKLNDEAVEKYLGNLKKEISMVRKRIEEVKARSVYIGGGTPGLMKPEQITDLVQYLRANFEIPNDVLFSIDISPALIGDPSLERKVETMLQNGVNRVSIGGVELNDSALVCQGRKHTAEDMVSLIDYLRNLNPRPQIATDMMIGVPNQTLETWNHTLQTLIEKGVDCIMAFPLMFKTSQPNWRDYVENPNSFPSVKERAEMYMLAMLKFQKAGYNHAPLHYFNKSPDVMHQQQLNKFETLDETGLLGIGVSSFGFVNGYQYFNTCTIGEYNRRIENSEIPVWKASKLSKRQLFEREVMFRLFSRGLGKRKIEEKYGLSVDGQYAPIIERLEGVGLLESTPDYLRLTELGILFAEEVCDKFAGEDIRRKAEERALLFSPKDPIQRYNYNMIGHRLR